MPRKENPSVLMPSKLTADIGAKALLIGEFAERLTLPNPDRGSDPDEPETMDLSVPIKWDTIKTIYDTIVKHYAEAVPAEQPQPTETLAELRECYEILLKTARRCARDLRHAVDLMQLETKNRYGFDDRIRLYETVFAGVTDYKLELHRKIDTLEAKLAGNPTDQPF